MWFFVQVEHHRGTAKPIIMQIPKSIKTFKRFVLKMLEHCHPKWKGHGNPKQNIKIRYEKNLRSNEKSYWAIRNWHLEVCLRDHKSDAAAELRQGFHLKIILVFSYFGLIFRSFWTKFQMFWEFRLVICYFKEMPWYFENHIYQK